MTDPPPAPQLGAEWPVLKGVHPARDGVVPGETGESPTPEKGVGVAGSSQ